MDPLSSDQLAAKVLYLEQENARLRAEALDLKVRAGMIRLAPPQPAAEPATQDDSGQDG